MESVSVATLTQEVRVALDRNNASGTLFSGNIDTLTLDEMIKDRLVDAARIVEMSAPLHMLVGAEVASVSASNISWSTDTTKPTCGTIQAIANLMRLVRFKMSDWDYAVTEAITEDSPLYSRLKSRYAGITGNAQRPAVAIVMGKRTDTSEEGGDYTAYDIEFYGSTHTSGASTPTAEYAYVSQPKIFNNSLNICPLCRQAIVAYAGHLVAGTLGETALASVLLDEARSLMQTDN